MSMTVETFSDACDGDGEEEEEEEEEEQQIDLWMNSESDETTSGCEIPVMNAGLVMIDFATLLIARLFASLETGNFIEMYFKR